MITETHELIPGETGSGVLIIADHASPHVPDHIDLGICPTVLNRHVAVDIGVEALVRVLTVALAAPGIVARVSRLVIDFNRDENAPGLIPHDSDGIEIPGNKALCHVKRSERIERYHRAYHDAVGRTVEDSRPVLIVSVHSFTPCLETRPDEKRPWQIGVLYNEDDRAARVAIPLLEKQDWVVGDNQPYSGKLLNYTMNRHAEANGIPYLGLEVRQDEIACDAGVTRLSALLGPVIVAVRDALA